MSKLLKKLKAEASKLKQKEEERGTFNEKVPYFTTEKGDNIIRILPNWKDKDELFFKPVNIHFGVPITTRDGNVIKIPVRCLRDFDEDCPLCDEYKFLKDKRRIDGVTPLTTQQPPPKKRASAIVSTKL